MKIRRTHRGLVIALVAMIALVPIASADGWWPNSGCGTKHTTASAANMHAQILNLTRGWWHGWHVHQWGDGYWRCHQRG